MECTIRPALESDAEDVSRVILRSLRETNARDYSQKDIERIGLSFSPSGVRELLRRRTMFVAVAGAEIVGTASLDGRAVRTVFVAPEAQGRGVGRLLMAEIERTARETGVDALAVPSSVTAEPFYARLGFKPVRDSHHGDERTIVMERSLQPP